MIRKEHIRVIHHNADNDGIMSATLAKLAFVESNFEILGIKKDTSISFFGYNYETDSKWMHNIFENDLTKFVFIDITPTIEFLESVKKLILSKNVEIEIFDHHHMKYDDIMKTQIPVTYHYSDRWCGSKIFYDWLIEKTGNKLESIFEDVIAIRLSSFVNYVDLYDTWKFVNENVYNEKTRQEVILTNKYLDVFKSQETFADVIRKISWGEIYGVGKYLLLKDDENNRNIINSMIIGEDKIFLFGPSSYQVQEAIQKSTTKPKLLIFANMKDLMSGNVTLGLRSAVPNTIDCAVEAHKLNPTGGGHKEAAGCTMNYNDFVNVVAESQEYQEANKLRTDEYRKKILRYYDFNLAVKLWD